MQSAAADEAKSAKSEIWLGDLDSNQNRRSHYQSPCGEFLFATASSLARQSSEAASNSPAVRVISDVRDMIRLRSD